MIEEKIIKEARKYLPELNEERLKEAYAFAEKVHEGQIRFSREPYLTHPLESAKLLLPLRPDEDTLIACLLHDVLTNGEVLVQEVEKKFGKEVANLIQGVEKLKMVKVQETEEQVENWQRMFLAMAKDLRVVLIKLAERLHNMQTLEYVARDKRERLARETLDVYAPIASRLGIYYFKSKLEDLCFQYLFPYQFANIQEQIKERGRLRQEYIDQAKKDLEKVLKEEGIEARVEGRVKHLYSIYTKLKRKNRTTIDEIYDLFAMRIILPDKLKDDHESCDHCYSTLGAIHRHFIPVPHRFKDYIAVPKINGYRSLHTTVLGFSGRLKNQPVEIQIRTETMHREAEYGIASHWWYKEIPGAELSREAIKATLEEKESLERINQILERSPELRQEIEALAKETEYLDEAEVERIKEKLRTARILEKDLDFLVSGGSRRKFSPYASMLRRQLDWLFGLTHLHEEVESGKEYLEGLKFDIFKDRIFVLTPQGEIKDLPMGATPVDFAYAVHSDVGHRCHQAKVNGRIASLDYELKNGDVVEILTREKAEPNRYWLSFVKTNLAKNRIKNWFRLQNRELNVKGGRDLLNQQLKKLGQPMLDPNLIQLKNYGRKKLSCRDREYLIECLGNGTLTVSEVLKKLFTDEELLKGAAPKEKEEKKTIPPEGTVETKEQPPVLITGEANLPVVFASCCKPKFPDPICGYVTRGNRFTIHRTDCSGLKASDQSRTVSAEWEAKVYKKRYQVGIRLEAEDRVGLMRDVTQIIASLEINIQNVRISPEDIRGRVSEEYLLEISDFEQLDRLIFRLENVPGIKKVQKL